MARGGGSSAPVKLAVLVAALVLAVLGWRTATRPVPTERDATPIDLAPDPLQVDIAREERTPLPLPLDIPDSQLELDPLAEYRVAAEVVGVKRYRGGWQGDVVPYDLGLAWGEVPRDDVMAELEWWQSHRWLYYSWNEQAPLDPGYISSHSSNHHVIPASDNIRRAIARLDEGDRIEAEGYLVAIRGTRNGHPVGWASSVSRDDRGDGACELMLIERLKVDGKVYR